MNYFLRELVATDLLANDLNANTHDFGAGFSYTKKLKPKLGAFANVAWWSLFYNQV